MIAIYYIATGEYTQFAEGFIETVKYFWPSEKKRVVMIGSEDMKCYEGNYEWGDVNYNFINHYPWPVISMYKFYIMKQHKVQGAKCHFIFNSNTQFCNEEFDYFIFENSIICTQHASCEANRIDYIQSGTICLPEHVFDSFCEEHTLRINEYVQKEFKVPKWHDETVLNEMLIRDKTFDYSLFPIEKGLRWQWCNKSPYPKKGLCYLRKATFKKQFKNKINPLLQNFKITKFMETKTKAICAIIKDEHLFLKEWIDYHLSIGFDRIYLYEDFTSKPHNNITDTYDNVELHSMSEIPRCVEGQTSRQCAVYNWFIQNMTNECDWCLFIDIDEFLRLEDGITLDSLLSEFEPYNGIQIWWKVYGCGEYIKRPNMGVQDAYGKDFKPHVKHGITNYDYKSFVNMKKGLSFINCHYHKKIVNTHHKRGDYRYSRNELTWDKCWIDHYITKSWEDWEVRLKRGNITKGIRDVEYFFKINPNMRGKIHIEKEDAELKGFEHIEV